MRNEGLGVYSLKAEIWGLLSRLIPHGTTWQGCSAHSLSFLHIGAPIVGLSQCHLGLASYSTCRPCGLILPHYEVIQPDDTPIIASVSGWILIQVVRLNLPIRPIATCPGLGSVMVNPPMTLVGLEPTTSRSVVRCLTNLATELFVSYWNENLSKVGFFQKWWAKHKITH